MTPFLTEPPLREGDRVALISPSSPAQQRHYDYAAAQLRSWGLDVVPGASVLARDERAAYLAGSDEMRRADIVHAWTDPSVAAVVALRGGYGAMRLLDQLDFAALREAAVLPDGRTKLLTGSSDITALHRAWHAHLRIPTLFSPMPGNAVFADSALIRADVRSWMMEPWAGRTVRGALDVAATAHSQQPAQLREPTVLVAGKTRGILTGGNLSLLAASIGAPESRPPGSSGTAEILVLEDVDESPRRVDNLLLQLQRAGWFASAAAIVLGSWEDCGENDEIAALLREYFAGLHIPVVAGAGIGHDPHAPAVGMGIPAELSAPAGGTPELRILKELA